MTTTATKPMTALTICQPYAELIARGEKPIENRTWPTSYRGVIAIHAGKSRDWLADSDERAFPGMAFGAVVATARLVACLRMDAVWPERWRHLQSHEHANGPWCWILEDVHRVGPFTARGAQGLWAWEPPLPGEAQSGEGRRPVGKSEPGKSAENSDV